MRDNHIIALMRDNYYTVEVTYGLGQGKAEGERTYTFKVPKDVQLNEGDAVVVPADSNSKPYTIVYVAKVHLEAELDFALDVDFKWIVSKVDTAQFDAIGAEEAEIRAAIVQSRKAQYRAQLKQSILESNPDLVALLEVKHG